MSEGDQPGEEGLPSTFNMPSWYEVVFWVTVVIFASALVSIYNIYLGWKDGVAKFFREAGWSD